MTTTLSACRWNWCTRTFSDHSALKEHVELDHIATVTPVKRSDVPLLKLVENGASLPESDFTNFLVSVTDSSSQAKLLPPNYVQRGVMTDPTEFSVPSTSDSSDVSGPAPDAGASPVQSPRPVNNDPPPMKFSEMRGTPSPTPSPLPPSPGTAYLVRKMKQNTLCPVSPRRTPHASLRVHRNRRYPRSEPSPSTPKAPDSTSRPTISIMVETDHTDSRYTNAAGADAPPSSQDIVESQLMILDDADSLHEMDIDSVLLPGLDSQWQPQSQLPLHDSFETSSLSSTVNPSQLHNVEEN